jgi:hypothetical protein
MPVGNSEVGCQRRGPLVPATHLSRAILLLASVLMASCAGHSPFREGSGEWVDPNPAPVENGAMTSLDWSKLPGVITLIDAKGVGAGYKQARLSPGRHVIEYAYYPVEFGEHPKGSVEIYLTPGHAYEFRIKLCFWCMPRKYAVWVDDKTRGEKVWGRHPDWPAWYL